MICNICKISTKKNIIGRRMSHGHCAPPRIPVSFLYEFVLERLVWDVMGRDTRDTRVRAFLLTFISDSNKDGKNLF